MIPPVFPLLSASSEIQALLPGAILRVFRAGTVPQGTAAPYIVWQTVTDVRENYLDGRPDMESKTVQVDCWASTSVAATQLGDAVERAIELDAYMVRREDGERDEETDTFRASLDFDFWLERV